MVSKNQYAWIHYRLYKPVRKEAPELSFHVFHSLRASRWLATMEFQKRRPGELCCDTWGILILKVSCSALTKYSNIRTCFTLEPTDVKYINISFFSLNFHHPMSSTFKTIGKCMQECFLKTFSSNCKSKLDFKYFHSLIKTCFHRKNWMGIPHISYYFHSLPILF